MPHSDELQPPNEPFARSFDCTFQASKPKKKKNHFEIGVKSSFLSLSLLFFWVEIYFVIGQLDAF